MQIYNIFLKNGVFCRKEKRMVVLMTFLGGDGCGGGGIIGMGLVDDASGSPASDTPQSCD